MCIYILKITQKNMKIYFIKVRESCIYSSKSLRFRRKKSS